MSSLPLVVVAMSGGVDSSVSAALLVEQGCPAVGLMLRLWSEPGTRVDNACCTPEAVEEARQVCAQLGIAFTEVDAREQFKQQIVHYFLSENARGATPNPCVVCNRLIKWGILQEQVRKAGGKYLATGHYARVQQSEDGRYQLLRAIDEQKDQSYVLCGLNQDQLAHTLFPLGLYHKPEVREMARRRGMKVAERKDSQDLCFIPDGDYRAFLAKYVPQVMKPGKIVNRQGAVLGEHQGLAFYTIGQRKGLGIAAAHPLFALEKNIENNTLVVGTDEELGSSELLVESVNWISGSAPGEPFRAQVKIRYKADFAWATLSPRLDGSVQVRFDHALRDITPGQFAVFYAGDQVLGGGMIKMF